MGVKAQNIVAPFYGPQCNAYAVLYMERGVHWVHLH